MNKDFTKDYEKLTFFVQENIEGWRKEYELTDEQVNGIYECLTLCEKFGIDPSTLGYGGPCN